MIFWTSQQSRCALCGFIFCRLKNLLRSRAVVVEENQEKMMMTAPTVFACACFPRCCHLQFDDDFYEFRCSIKELERRLGAVVSLAFDDCATVYGRFKLLDSFEGLLERPIIQVIPGSCAVRLNYSKYSKAHV